MRVLGIFVGKPRELVWRSQVIQTSIFKEPIKGSSVRVFKTHIDGDMASDLKVHGGEYRVVYTYSSLHYEYWWRELGKTPQDFPYGSVGENLVVENMNENDIDIGDHIRIGDVVLEAQDPRGPCFKLGIRLGDESMVKRFLDSGRLGIYYRVVQEGEMKLGDSVEVVKRSHTGVRSVQLLALRKNPDKEKLKKVLDLPTLSPQTRKKLESLL